MHCRYLSSGGGGCWEGNKQQNGSFLCGLVPFWLVILQSKTTFNCALCHRYDCSDVPFIWIQHFTTLQQKRRTNKNKSLNNKLAYSLSPCILHQHQISNEILQPLEGQDPQVENQWMKQGYANSSCVDTHCSNPQNLLKILVETPKTPNMLSLTLEKCA